MAANNDQIEPKHQSLAYEGSDVKYGPATAKLDTERRLLAEMRLPYSAERLIDASFAAESSQRTQDEAQESADRLQIGAGAFIAGGDVLGSPAEANEVIEELKRSLATKGKSKEPDDLVNLWIRAEPWLDDREIADLWSDFAAKLPGEPERINRSRGAGAQGEGARAQGEGR
jgi:hypothetical protein